MTDGKMIAILEELRDEYKNPSNSIKAGYYEALDMAINFLTAAVDNSIALEKMQKECCALKCEFDRCKTELNDSVQDVARLSVICEVLWKVIEVIAK